MKPGAPVVAASDLTAEYAGGRGHGSFLALSGVTFTLGDNELLGLVGESGSGKSTLAMAVAGLADLGRRQPDLPRIVGGSLLVLGEQVRRAGGRARKRIGAEVGYLPQNAGRTLVPGFTIAENVAAPLLARDPDFDRHEAGIRTAVLLDAVQLPLSSMTKFPADLSSGQRQRVAIARSLVLRPKLWVADEPTAGVDVTVRGPVLDSILELQSEHSFSALIVSHDLAISARLTDRIAVLQKGILVGLGKLEDVIASPVHPYVAGLADDYAMRTGPIELPRLP